jgi:hypothetical protein
MRFMLKDASGYTSEPCSRRTSGQRLCTTLSHRLSYPGGGNWPDCTPRRCSTPSPGVDRRVRLAVAHRPDLSQHMVEQLAGDECWVVRLAIARRLDLASEVAERMTEDEEWEVRMAVAQRLRSLSDSQQVPTFVLGQPERDGWG